MEYDKRQYEELHRESKMILLDLQEERRRYGELYHELEQVRLKGDLEDYLSRHRGESQIDNVLTERGDWLIRAGEYDEGMKLLLSAYDYLSEFGIHCDIITLYLRLAQYYIDYGDEKKGKQFLHLLCTDTVSNYEDALKRRHLQDVWQKYKRWIEDELPKKERMLSMPIGDIMALSGDKLLLEIGVHVQEMSEYGECLRKLNKWERIFYDLYDFSSRINSGGMDEWLSYSGKRYSQTLSAAKIVGAEKTVSILTLLPRRFPDGMIPKSLYRIEDMIITLDLEFENEDEKYFETAEPELLKMMEKYVRENRKHFR